MHASSGGTVRLRVAIIVAACGLATAFLTLGTAFVEYRSRTEAERQTLLRQTREAEDRARVAEAEARAAQRLAEIRRREEQHRAACSQNREIMRVAELRFADLRARHGIFLQNIKNCAVNNAGNDRDRTNCQGAVCIAFDFYYRGTNVSCAETLLERDNVVEEIRGARSALIRDECGPASSPALEFMDY